MQKIVDLWSTGRGVVSLHVFQNTVPTEALTREAAMIDAIGKFVRKFYNIFSHLLMASHDYLNYISVQF